MTFWGILETNMSDKERECKINKIKSNHFRMISLLYTKGKIYFSFLAKRLTVFPSKEGQLYGYASSHRSIAISM